MGRVVFVADYEWQCFCVKTSIKSFLEVESHGQSWRSETVWEDRKNLGGKKTLGQGGGGGLSEVLGLRLEEERCY